VVKANAVVLEDSEADLVESGDLGGRLCRPSRRGSGSSRGGPGDRRP
jgi:hypothetical protein